MSLDQLEMSCESANIGTFSFNLEKKSIQWNSVLRSICGFSDDQEITLGLFLNQVVPEDIPLLYERFEKILAGETIEYKTEYRIKINNEIKWVHVDGKVYPGTKIMYGIVTDITVRKNNELYLLELLENTELNKKNIHDFMSLIKAVF